MKQLLLIATAWIFCLNLSGQSLEPASYCGTSNEKNHWLQHYLENKSQYQTENDEIIANMKLHILGNDNGTGYFLPVSILDALCTVSNDFEEANIKYYLSEWINYIPNTDWNNHMEFNPHGRDILIENYEYGFLNAYIATEAAGNCGYFWSPGNNGEDGVIMAKSCTQPQDHTFAHELGHFLSLPHTFSGWEGSTYDPETPTIQQFPGWGSIENVNDPNCNNKADGFCDTPPDYLAYRWPCEQDNFSTVEQTDLGGNTFRSDGTLFMSYASDNCSSRFSPEQIDAMRANLQFQRSELILDDVTIEEVDDSNMNLVYPAQDDLVPSNSLTLTWDPVPGATMYLLELTRYPFTGVKIVNQFVNDNSFTVMNLPAEKTLAYRIRPFNEGYFCTSWSDRTIFETFFVSSANEVDFVRNLSIYPSPAGQNDLLNIEFQSTESVQDAQLSLSDLTGKVLQATEVEILSGMNRFQLYPEGVSAGIYLLNIETEMGSLFQKVLIQ